MDDDELIKEIPQSEEEGIMKNLEEDESLKFKKILILGSICVVLLIIIIIILVLAKNDKSKSNKDNNYGLIRCIYFIETKIDKTQLLSKEFTNTKGISLFIKGEKQSSISEFQFDNLGENEINFTIPNKIDMTNMFKDISTLKSVELISENNNTIISSMESTFENCINLENFSIIGFDTSKIKSFKKTFYSTDLNELKSLEINATNAEDMSYMFAKTKITELDLSKMITNNLKDISYMFNNCQSLSSLNLTNFKTDKVINMSNLFSYCLPLRNLDIKDFDTSNVEDMSGLFSYCVSLSN